MTLSLLCLALFPAWAGAAERPSWVKDPSSDYPRATYLTGVGEGPTSEKAADNARAELEKSISLSVQTKSRSSISETSNGRASSPPRRSQTKCAPPRQRCSTESRSPVSGKAPGAISRLRCWTDPQLEDPARPSLGDGQRVARLGREPAAHRGEVRPPQVGAPATDLIRLAAASTATTACSIPRAKAWPPPPEAAAAAGEARKAAAALTLRVEAEGEQGETVAVRIIDGLASRGLRASQGGTGTPDLLKKPGRAAKPCPRKT